VPLPANREVQCRLEDSIQSRCGWWSARFHLHWDDGEEPDLSLDLLIADQVIRPMLLQMGEQVVYWRFHRRARRDSSGHQFTLHFFSSREVAQKIFSKLRENQVLNQLLACEVIERIRFDTTETESLRPFHSLNDKRWSEPMQQSWIWFAQGVSATWLQIVTEFRMSEGGLPQDVQEMRVFYQAISDRVLKLWKHEGKVAFLHHLNALFGYGPVEVDGEEQTF
jgi:hypothetical protein